MAETSARKRKESFIVKKSLFALAVSAMLALVLFPALAEGNGCWYYAQNGSHDFEQTDFHYAICTQCGLRQIDGEYPATSSPCNIWQDENGNTIYALCRDHSLMYKDAFSMLEDDYAESLLYSYLSCQNEILRLYDEWIACLPENAQESVEASRTLSLSFMETQRKAMMASYDALGIDAAPADVEYGMEYWMQAHTAWLCQMLTTLDGE